MTSGGSTALFVAAQRGHAQVVSKLVASKNCDLHFKCKDMNSLDAALHRNHLDVARILVRAGLRISGMQILPYVARYEPTGKEKDGVKHVQDAIAHLESQCEMFRAAAVTWQLTAMILQDEWERSGRK